MATITDIGTLIVRSPEIRGGRPRISGTGVTVRRIVGWYKLGLSPEEIAEEVSHLSLAQVYAALAYYHANHEEIEADIAADEAEAERLEREQATHLGPMTIRPYLEEDSMRHALVRALRARRVDVMTALDAGMIEREDQQHLEYAAARGRVLYSFNIKDFYRLHIAFLADGKSHAGIILARQQQYSVGEQTRRLLKLIAAKSPEEMKSQVEFFSAWG